MALATRAQKETCVSLYHLKIIRIISFLVIHTFPKLLKLSKIQGTELEFGKLVTVYRIITYFYDVLSSFNNK
jgi:hypothetical protein